MCLELPLGPLFNKEGETIWRVTTSPLHFNFLSLEGRGQVRVMPHLATGTARRAPTFYFFFDLEGFFAGFLAALCLAA
jgi:hypothetical protein